MPAIFKIIVACDAAGGVGKDNKIPWRHKRDSLFFSNITRGHTVIMGRKTYASIGHVLIQRKNYVLTKTVSLESGVKSGTSNLQWFTNIHDCINACEGEVFICGGVEIYDAFLRLNIVSEIIRSNIAGDFTCDRLFSVPPCFTLSKSVNYEMLPTSPYYTGSADSCEHLYVSYFTYVNECELKFLELGRRLLHADYRGDRTGTGTFSEFGHQLTFDLSNNTLPLITTRRLFFRGIVEELLLFISGATDSKILEKRGVNVWHDNTSREFLDSRNLHHLPVGDMGPSYGFLMRHFGAVYKTCEANYFGAGVDQLSYVIRELRANPMSRRLIISLWDPINIDKCPLPPCLYNYQFYSVYAEPKPLLSCMMTQRSSDFAVAGGWNVATGSLLTYMIASVTGHEPHRLIWNIGDAHIYKNLVDKFEQQLSRNPRVFPKLYLTQQKNITDYTTEHFKLIGYNPHDKIDLPMNV
jgi:thymidylate synthase